MKKNKLYIILVILAACVIAFFGRHDVNSKSTKETELREAVTTNKESLENKTKRLEIVVDEGDVFSTVALRAGINEEQSFKLYEKVKPVYDLASLKIGHMFIFDINDKTELIKIVYNIDDERELIIVRASIDEDWQASINAINYEIKEKIVEGQLDGSLYASALKQGADEKSVIQFAESLEYSIDFANDPREGDKYKFVYEERYRDGKFVMPGRVLAGAYLNNGKLYQTFFYNSPSGEYNYYDENGNSAQKMFLRAPVSFKYISSPFTQGKRYVDKFGLATKHRAVDYVAAAGTPIRAVGDGVVVSAGWSTIGYGNMTKIKHSGVYSTLYAHQSKIVVKNGEKVSQGQVIGYVGSTGFSTGPHLHLEMIKNGVNVDPSKEILPPGKPIEAKDRDGFNKTLQNMKDKIKI
jgi:murein DD-endopeptidase MepM/ murein hydrolase activator NlpD